MKFFNKDGVRKDCFDGIVIEHINELEGFDQIHIKYNTVKESYEMEFTKFGSLIIFIKGIDVNNVQHVLERKTGRYFVL